MKFLFQQFKLFVAIVTFSLNRSILNRELVVMWLSTWPNSNSWNMSQNTWRAKKKKEMIFEIIKQTPTIKCVCPSKVNTSYTKNLLYNNVLLNIKNDWINLTFIESKKTKIWFKITVIIMKSKIQNQSSKYFYANVLEMSS